MRIAVCERDVRERDALTKWLHHCAAEKMLSFCVTPYDRGIDLLYDIGDGVAYDIIFLGDSHGADIIKTAQKLRKMHYIGSLILISKTPQYAVDGYAVEAAGYLLKPVSKTLFSQTMERVLKSKTITEMYRIRCRASFWQIPYREILYIESSNTKCLLHRHGGGEYVIYKTLNTVEEELADGRFLRCHQSFLVNMDHVLSADKAFHLSTGDTVPMRQRDVHVIRQQYIDYIEGTDDTPDKEE